MSGDSPSRPSFAPRHWASWLVVSMLWSLGWMPRRLGLLLVSPLGPLMFRFAGRRRKIALRNIERCFPHWPEEKKQAVLRAGFSSLARMIVETSWCWAGPLGRVVKSGRIHGLEHLEEAVECGNGVLLVTGHSTCLDIGGSIVAMRVNLGGIYRPLNNPVVEWFQTRGRLRYARYMISKRNARQAVKILRRGGVVWYAPDQDFGPEQTAFAPFFNIQTATLLATHRLPRMTGCAVLPMYPVYDPQSRKYDVYLLPALENYPSDDPVADLTRINAFIEEFARKAPEQYWWIHRRFKTRPEGEPAFYD